VSQADRIHASIFPNCDVLEPVKEFVEDKTPPGDPEPLSRGVGIMKSLVHTMKGNRRKAGISRYGVMLCSGLLVCTAGFLANLSCGGGAGSSAGSGSIPPPNSKIQHVVVIFQENRTPDNLFHDPVLIERGADLASSGVNSKGQTIPLASIPMVVDYGLDHSHSSFVLMCDQGSGGCAMDGADKIPVLDCHQTVCPPPNAQFAYVQASDVAPYFNMAETYTFADRMFETNQGPSFPAHQFIISGTSAPTASSDLFAAENPVGVPNATNNTGCTAPVGETVALIDPSGSESSSQYPCFDHPTLPDLLGAQSFTWRYYAPSAGSIWTGPNAIQHLRMGPAWTQNVVLNQTQVLTDIAAGQLANVTWVIPSGQASDHSNETDGSGPSWVSSIVNAIGNSQFWSNTAIFIAWDDWGGWYDHVAPTLKNSYEYGFRVPMIVVSPYAKAAYISHVTHDFGSILKYIEENFGLSSLGYADADADDLSDCFDYNQTPLTFQRIAAPLDAKHFIEDKTPPTDPDDD
jgi:phospholipase C